MSLSRSELRSWRKLAGGVKALLEALDRQLRRDAAISHDEYMILSRLYRAGGRGMRMSDLARDGSFSPSRLSHMVKRLEGEGWVRRTRGLSDARVVEARLSEAGIAKVRRATPKHLQLVETLLFGTLGAEQARLTAEAMDQIRQVAEEAP